MYIIGQRRSDSALTIIGPFFI